MSGDRPLGDDDPTPPDTDDASLRTTQSVLVDMSVLSSSIQQVQEIVSIAAEENQETIASITAELIAVRHALLVLREDLLELREHAAEQRRRSGWGRRDETRVSVVGFAGAIVSVVMALFGQVLISFAGAPMPPGFEAAATVMLAGLIALALPADILSRLKKAISRKRLTPGRDE